MGSLDINLLESQYGDEAASLSIHGTLTLDDAGNISGLEIAGFSPPKTEQEKPQKPKNGHSTLREKALIGEGGMGSIFSVEQRTLERDVALKELKPKLAEDPDHRTKFLEEAVITGQLEHPNIPPTYHLDEKRCRWTMKKIKGQDLEKIIKSGNHNQRELVRMLIPVCDALTYAHARGVLHKDIKPENIMVGEQGEVYLMDWGVAQVNPAADQPKALKRISKRRDIKDGQISGTPLYMAPEQAAGRTTKLDERADVYAFGVMLYYIQTGRLPVTIRKDQGGVLQLLAKKINPDTKIRKAKGDLGAIAHKCIAFDKKNRYSNMLEVKKDIQNFLENQKVSARRYGPIASAMKWVQNNAGKTVAALGITMGLAIGGGAGIAAINANAEKVKAEAAIVKTEAVKQKLAADKDKAEAAKETAEAEKVKADARAKAEAEKRAEAAEQAKTALEEKLTAEQKATAAAERAKTEAEKRAEAEKAKAEAEAEAKKSLEEKLKAEQELSQLSEKKRKAVLLNNDAKQQLDYARHLQNIAKKKEAIETAVRELIKAKALDPELVSIYHNLGFAHSLLGRQKEAIEYYTRALQIDANYGLSYYGRGNMHLDIGNIDQAIADYEKAKKTQGLNVDVYLNLGVCYMRIGAAVNTSKQVDEANANFSKAIANLEEALRIDPKNKMAHANLGETYLQQGKYKEAERELLSAIVHGDYYSHLLAAETLYQAARARQPLYPDWQDRAKKHLSDAVDIDPALAKEADKIKRKIR